MRKKITIKTKAFDLIINWDTGIASLVLTLFIGLLAIALFAKAVPIKTLALAGMIIEFLVCLIMSLFGASLDVEELDPPVANVREVSVQAQSTQSSVQSTAAIEANSDYVIKNKVNIPVAPAPPTSAPEIPSPIIDDNEDAWNELFNM